MTTVPTGLPLKLARLVVAPDAKIGEWATKTEACRALGELRARGLNVDVEVEARRAWLSVWRVWVLARPDHYEGVTYLMNEAGGWLRGRLIDVAPCYHDHGTQSSWEAHPVPWEPLDVKVFPAPFTHVTRVVRDSANRHEQYRTKSNGSCGRWVENDAVVAVCVCGWKRWADNRTEGQSQARAHRANPDAEPKLQEMAGVA